jgi:hypothetical protein
MGTPGGTATPRKETEHACASAIDRLAGDETFAARLEPKIDDGAPRCGQGVAGLPQTDTFRRELQRRPINDDDLEQDSDGAHHHGSNQE